MSEEQNPVLGYADSYRTMARIARAEGGATTVEMFSVVTDLERNIAPLFDTERLRAETAEAELAALREELAQKKSDIKDLAIACGERGEALTAAEQRNESLLGTARELTIQLHATIGNTEHHDDCVRDLAALEAVDAKG